MTTDDEQEVSAVVEVDDETGAFEYTLYSLTAPPYIRLYVPGLTPSDANTWGRCSAGRVGRGLPKILVGWATVHLAPPIIGLYVR